MMKIARLQEDDIELPKNPDPLTDKLRADFDKLIHSGLWTESTTNFVNKLHGLNSETDKKPAVQAFVDEVIDYMCDEM